MDPNDINAVVPVLDKGLYAAIGGLVVWLISSGYLTKIWAWWREGKKEIREEAKEAPERELKVVHALLDKQEMTLNGVIAELTKMRDHYHACEVKQAKNEAKIEAQAEEIIELRAENDAQKQKIQSLEEQIRLQSQAWQRTEVKVQEVQKQQDQQSK